MPYAFCEQIGKEIRDISDEIPFEIPESWEWCRISNLFQLINGDRGKNYPSKEKLHESGEIPFISAINMQNGTVNKSNLLYVDKEQYDKLNSGKLFQNDLVVCIRGSLGKFCIYPFDIGAIASSLVILRRFGEINNDFLALYIQSPLFFDEIRKYDNGTAQPNLSAKDLSDFFLPIPPLSEQKRIVAKIEELLPYIERYGKAEEHLTALNTTFPEALKKSILQEAVQGKLVPQNPDDEPASVLLERIRAEKQELIKAGKIKKDKPLAPITEEEIPFEIPDNWCWCRLGEIGETNIGLTYQPSDITDSSGVLVLRSSNIQNGQMDYNDNVYVSCDIPERALIHKGDILICARNGSRALVGKCALVDKDGMAFGAFMAKFNSPYNQYIKVFLDSPLFRQQLEGVKTETINQITQDVLKKQLIPFPPLAEQKRIVAKIEEIMPIISTI